MASGKVYPTVDEAISYLKRSSLPTIVTEGSDDVIVFRRLEDELADIGVNLFPVGSRDAVLGIYNRRSEITGRSDIVYVADKDLWVFASIPDDYVSDEVFFSDGYSIENDLFRDGRVRDLMTAAERDQFEADMREFSKWYALAVSRNIGGMATCLDVSPHEFLSSNERKQHLLEMQQDEEFPSDIYDLCVSKYEKLMRGKSLMALAVRHLSYTSRPVKHSRKSIMEQCAVRGGEIISATKFGIESYFRKAA